MRFCVPNGSIRGIKIVLYDNVGIQQEAREMAQPKIYEGTGDELAPYLRENPKRHFRLIVLPEEETEEAFEQSLKELFEEAEKAVPEPGKCSSDPLEADFGLSISLK
jgi:hypothetical protein